MLGELTDQWESSEPSNLSSILETFGILENKSSNEVKKRPYIRKSKTQFNF
jgi:hypothetical protein